MKVAVELEVEQWGAVVNILNNVPGMENAKVLVPIYDTIKEAVQAATGEADKEE